MGSDSAGAKTFEYASLQVCSWNSRFFSARVALASGQWPWKKSWKAFRTSVRASMSDSERLLGDPPQAVWIHVYDLVQANVYLHALGAGLYHTSVEVHGKEWAFGGHSMEGQTGIYAVPASSMPREPGARVGTQEQQYVYRTSLIAGKTELTEREVEVLRLAARGLTNKAIGQELGISGRTVQGHLANIYGKMHVGSRTEAVTEALKQGWITIE